MDVEDVQARVWSLKVAFKDYATEASVTEGCSAMIQGFPGEFNTMVIVGSDDAKWLPVARARPRSAAGSSVHHVVVPDVREGGGHVLSQRWL